MEQFCLLNDLKNPLKDFYIILEGKVDLYSFKKQSLLPSTLKSIFQMREQEKMVELKKEVLLKDEIS